MRDSKEYNLIFIYTALFLLGIKTLFHGFPDIERFFAEWMDERIMLTNIMKFGTLNFAPSIIVLPPLYHYLTFIPIAIFFIFGKLIGFFQDRIDFVNFYFNNTHYFFLIGRIMSYLFYWLAAIVIFRTVRLFYSRTVAHISVLSYLLVPRLIFDFSTTRPETLLFLTGSIFFYFFLKYYLKNKRKYLFIAAFVLGAATATKYNAIYLGSIFIPFLVWQLKKKNFYYKNGKEFIVTYLAMAFFIFIGFFVCNPFFLVKFGTYFHNLAIYSAVEMKYYLTGSPTIFGLTHLQQLTSVMYANFFGLLVLVLGSWGLFKKDKKLFIFASFTILVYEVYFGIFSNNYSPLRYLNPLLPIALLIFSTGINFIITQRKEFRSVLIIFGLILSYNYFDIWQGLSFGPTYLQKARYFIEQTIPEFTTICLTSKSHLPQLNMTEESYHRLIDTAPAMRDISGHELHYKEMDNREDYDRIYSKLRIESLAKKPQYNLLRWDSSINTEEDATNFLKKYKVKYILSTDLPMISNKRLVDAGIVSLVTEFRPRNKRIYGNLRLYLYKVN